MSKFDAAAAAPELAVPLLRLAAEDENDTSATLASLRPAGGVLVVDVWTTRCERCPAALDKIEKLAAAEAGLSPEAAAAPGRVPVAYASVCAGLEVDMAEELVEEGEWDHISHTYAEPDAKAALKAAWGFKAVPFVAVVDVSGKVVATGSPAKMDLPALVLQASSAVPEPVPVPEPVLEEPAAEPAARPALSFGMDDDF